MIYKLMKIASSVSSLILFLLVIAKILMSINPIKIRILSGDYAGAFGYTLMSLLISSLVLALSVKLMKFAFTKDRR